MRIIGRLLALWMVWLVASVPSQARACQCIIQTLEWSTPTHNAQGVPVDIAPVLGGVFDVQTVTFTDDAGTAVEFALNHYPGSSCRDHWAELLPKQVLAPNTRYTIRVKGADPDDLEDSFSFETGQDVVPDEELEPPPLEAAMIMPEVPNCLTSRPTPVACIAGLTATASSELELFVRRGDEILVHTTGLKGPNSSFTTWQVPDCIELRRRAFDGRRSESVQLCGDALLVSERGASQTNGQILCLERLAATIASKSAAQDAGATSQLDAAADSDTPSSSCAVAARAPLHTIDFWLLIAMSLPLVSRERFRNPVVRARLHALAVIRTSP